MDKTYLEWHAQVENDYGLKLEPGDKFRLNQIVRDTREKVDAIGDYLTDSSQIRWAIEGYFLPMFAKDSTLVRKAIKDNEKKAKAHARGFELHIDDLVALRTAGKSTKMYDAEYLELLEELLKRQQQT